MAKKTPNPFGVAAPLINDVMSQSETELRTPVNPYAPPAVDKGYPASRLWLRQCFLAARFAMVGLAVSIACQAVANSIVFTAPTSNIVGGIILAAALTALIGAGCYCIVRQWQSNTQTFALTPTLAVVFFITAHAAANLHALMHMPGPPGLLTLPAALATTYWFSVCFLRH